LQGSSEGDDDGRVEEGDALGILVGSELEGAKVVARVLQNSSLLDCATTFSTEIVKQISSFS